MIVEGLFSDCGFGGECFKVERREKILENVGLTGVKSHNGSVRLESV